MFKIKVFFRQCFLLAFVWGLAVSSVFYRPLFAGDIVIYGDSRHDQAAQRKVVQAIMPFKPEIVFHTGDLVDHGDDPGQWEIFKAIAAPLLSSAEYYPALGNHEMESPLYFKNFPIIYGQPWYSLQRGGIHFIILDSNVKLGLGSEQYKWLEEDLRRARGASPFKIVILHHPLFNIGQHSEDEKGLKEALLPLFTTYGVDAVFSGHDHSYQRFEYQGIYFIVTGGGGAPLTEASRRSPHLIKFRKAYHFCLVSPQGDVLRVRVIDADKKLIDDFKILPTNPKKPLIAH